MTEIDASQRVILTIYSEKDPFIAIQVLAAIINHNHARFIGTASIDEARDILQEEPEISAIVIECEEGNEARIAQFVREVKDHYDYDVIIYSRSQACLLHFVDAGICSPSHALLSEQVVERLPKILTP